MCARARVRSQKSSDKLLFGLIKVYFDEGLIFYFASLACSHTLLSIRIHSVWFGTFHFLSLAQLKSEKDWTTTIKVDCHKIQIRIHSNLFIYIWRWLFPIHFRKICVRARAFVRSFTTFQIITKLRRCVLNRKIQCGLSFSKSNKFSIIWWWLLLLYRISISIMSICGVLSTRLYGLGTAEWKRERKKERESGKEKYTKELNSNTPKNASTHKHTEPTRKFYL